jgi:uncharacterized protein YjbJ (UPF0337 family)
MAKPTTASPNRAHRGSSTDAIGDQPRAWGPTIDPRCFGYIEDMTANDKIDQAKGRAEQAAGDITDNDELKSRGERHEAAGKLKGRVADIRDRIDDTITNVEEKLDKASTSSGQSDQNQ